MKKQIPEYCDYLNFMSKADYDLLSKHKILCPISVRNFIIKAEFKKLRIESEMKATELVAMFADKYFLTYGLMAKVIYCKDYHQLLRGRYKKKPKPNYR